MQDDEFSLAVEKSSSARPEFLQSAGAPLNFTESQGVFTLGHAGEVPYFQAFNFGNLSAGA
jgi:hypothetical protein